MAKGKQCIAKDRKEILETKYDGNKAKGRISRGKNAREWRNSLFRKCSMVARHPLRYTVRETGGFQI